MASLAHKISDWIGADLITAEQGEKVLEFEQNRKSVLSPFLALGLVGVFAVGLGIVAIVAANWQDIPAGLKLTAMFATLAANAVAAVRVQGKKPAVFEALLFSQGILFFAAMGLVGQIFHLQSETWKTLAFWSALSCPPMLLTKKVLFGFLWEAAVFGAFLTSPFAEKVFDDIAFGLKNFASEMTDEEIKTAVKDAMETVGLSYEEVKDKSPFELSGGQKRRAAIAGVIVTKPKILVLDEPAAGLDPLGKEEIAALLKRVHEDWCETVIVISHDMDEIAELCNRAAVFSEGKAVFCDSPERLFTLHAEELLQLGLDIPETAKIQRELRLRGINVQSDLTLKGFVTAAAQAMGYGETATREGR